jgi:hypothetical protein
MSEFKGTPGPWDYWSGYNAYDKIEAQVTAEGGDIVIASYNHLIADGEANAKLIAAAPDLLEELKDLKRELVLSDVDLGYIESHFRPWLNKAESAVAKALDYLFCPMTTDAKATRGWISVESQLPEEDVEVLCTDLSQVFIASQHNSFFTNGDHGLQYVTHWQPLPELPTE